MPVLEDRIVKNALSKRFDGDQFDRLSHRYSTLLFIFASLLVGGKQLVSERIRCFTPAEFTLPQTAYVNDYCYVVNTYYVAPNELMPGPKGPKEMINYYQWVSLFLLVQSLLFLLPVLIWRYLCGNISVQIDGLVRNLIEVADKCSKDNRRNTIKELVLRTDGYLASRRVNVKVLGRTFRKATLGSVISLLNMFVKLMYLINCVGQLLLVNKFLGGNGYALWGFNTIRELFTTGQLPLSDIFPLVTMCDLAVRRLGQNRHRYTIQCALPVNVFHDRVYLAIWFWLCFVGAMTTAGVLSWLRLHLCNKNFIKRHLTHRGRCPRERDLHLLTEFIEKYLSTDGVYLLKLVYTNTRCVEFDEFVAALWDHFVKNRSKRERAGRFDSASLTEHGGDSRKYQSVAVNMEGDGYESSVIF